MNKLSLATLAASLLIAPSIHAASISGQGTWESTLQGRDLDGNLATIEAYYDTVLDITWLADANYAMTSGYDDNGRMDWASAKDWAASLDLDGVAGADGWRLPTLMDTGSPGCNYANAVTDCGYNVNTMTSEFAHLFYITLGNKAYFDMSGSSPQAGWGLTNTGLFENVQSYYYWAGLGDELVPGAAWFFNFHDGLQYPDYDDNNYLAWAVHEGDVGVALSSVPVPAAAWLFGSGLIGLIGFAKRKTSK